MKRVTLSLGLLLSMTAFNVQAQTQDTMSKKMKSYAKPTQEQMDKMFDKMDANGDGKLEKSEMGKRMQDKFDLIDMSKDGFIDKDEFKNAPMHSSKMHGKMKMKAADLDKMFDKMDANGDGKLEKSELGQRMQDKFDLMDSNQDGYLMKDELNSMSMDASKMGEKMKKKAGDLDKMFNKMDANGDGKLEKSEMGKRMQNKFDLIDADKDGYVSLEEIEAAPMPDKKMNRKKGRKGGMRRR